MRSIGIGFGVVAVLAAAPWSFDGAGIGFDSAYAQERGRPSLSGGARERRESGSHDTIIGRPGNGPSVGSEAPDFSLLPAKFYEFGIDDTDITVDNADRLYAPVRLSDFRGKKPVVLIFGSYT